ncbi:transposase [Candidatus Saccharibacteria bacterium]|nr:transposase [Candidatus Saccharibacteria bacterium]
MPKRNRIKIYGSGQYYHLYNRGVDRQNIFQEPGDYFYFLSLLKRHLSDTTATDSYGRAFAKFSEEVELMAFCLMPNHFHILCYLKEPDGIVHLMRSVMTAYSMYFNKKYQRTGGLYEGPFLASRIENEAYLWHVSRYIHLNPLDIGQDFRQYPYSSIAYFAGEKKADWLRASNLIETDKDVREYLEFVADYETMHKEMKYLKNLLAA